MIRNDVIMGMMWIGGVCARIRVASTHFIMMEDELVSFPCIYYTLFEYNKSPCSSEHKRFFAFALYQLASF